MVRGVNKKHYQYTTKRDVKKISQPSQQQLKGKSSFRGGVLTMYIYWCMDLWVKVFVAKPHNYQGKFHRALLG